MKLLRKFSGPLALLLTLSMLGGCASSTMIRSQPTGAKVYMDDEQVGTTPYKYSDTKIVGSATGLRLEHQGYQPLSTVLIRNEKADVGAIIGGIFFLVPFLWTMGYKPTHTYELKPLESDNANSQATDQTPLPDGVSGHTPPANASRADRLRELKRLLDDGVITPDEFEKEKKQILDEN